MSKLLKDYSAHIGIGTAIAILLALFAFGRNVGGYEEDYKDVKETVERHEIELKEIPILKTNQETLISGQNEIRQDIKTLLKRK